MPPATHTTTEEEDFMNNLLEGLNDSFFDAVPSPDPSPVKHRQSRPPHSHSIIHATPINSKSTSKPAKKLNNGGASSVVDVQDVDMAALVEGAEHWDWDDMESDFLTPKKEKIIKAKPKSNITWSQPGYRREQCTRCIAEDVVEGDVAGRYHKVYITGWSSLIRHVTNDEYIDNNSQA